MSAQIIECLKIQQPTRCLWIISQKWNKVNPGVPRGGQSRTFFSLKSVLKYHSIFPIIVEYIIDIEFMGEFV